MMFCTILLCLIFIPKTYTEMLVYSMLSCASLEPRPLSLVLESPNSTLSLNSTKTFPPPSGWNKFNLRYSMDNKDIFSVNHSMKIYIDANFYYSGIMVQVTSLTKNYDPLKVLGHFDEGDQIKRITCPQGDKQGNTIINYDKPRKFKKFTLKWHPSPDISTRIGVWVSVLHEGIVHPYRKVLKPMKTQFPPASTHRCGVDMHCFRSCPYWLDDCEVHEARSMVIIENSTDTIDFTLGLNRNALENHIAVGISQGPNWYEDFDVSMCYLSHAHKMVVKHFFMETLNGQMMDHIEDLSLKDSYIDDKTVWCKLQRVLDPLTANGLNLSKEVTIMVFTGVNNNQVPSKHQLFKMTVRSQISHLNEYINGIGYVSAASVTSSDNTCENAPH